MHRVKLMHKVTWKIQKITATFVHKPMLSPPTDVTVSLIAMEILINTKIFNWQIQLRAAVKMSAIDNMEFSRVV